MKTILNDRVLWFDGKSSVNDENLISWILNGNNINDVHALKNTDILTNYNNFADVPITVKKEVNELNISWNIPKYFLDINIKKFILSKLMHELEITVNSPKKCANRVILELSLFKKFGLEDLLRTIIYIISTFEHKNIIWGTGRGSSCSSYILYLIGLHDVDSVKYDLDPNEFFKYKYKYEDVL